MTPFCLVFLRPQQSCFDLFDTCSNSLWLIFAESNC